jgi:hypothetical protein
MSGVLGEDGKYRCKYHPEEESVWRWRKYNKATRQLEGNQHRCEECEYQMAAHKNNDCLDNCYVCWSKPVAVHEDDLRDLSLSYGQIKVDDYTGEPLEDDDGYEPHYW